MSNEFQPFLEYDFNPNSLPSAFLKAIGEVTANAAQTEHIVEMAIAGTVGADMEYGGALTTHMSAPLRDDVLRSIAQIRINDLDWLDELDELLDSVHEAQKKRNKIIHNSWCIEPESKDVFRLAISSRGSFEMELIPMTVPEIEEISALIYSAGINLLGFIRDKGLMPPEPPADRPRFAKDRKTRKARRRKMGK